MKKVAYLLLIIGLIPITYLLLLALFEINYSLRDEFSLTSFYRIIFRLLFLSGYVGLFTLLKGFHKTNHKLKLTLLSLGVCGFLYDRLVYSKISLITWYMDEHDPVHKLQVWFIFLSLLFIGLLINDFTKTKRLAHS